MSDEERIQQQLLRLQAAQHTGEAAKLRMAAAAIGAAAALRELCVAVQASVDFELAQHPDMAELNVRLDGHYGEMS